MDGTPLIIHARMLLPQGDSLILDMCDGVVPSIPDLLPEGYSPPVIKVLHTYIAAIPGLAAIADEIYILVIYTTRRCCIRRILSKWLHIPYLASRMP
jgi:hypothetical protein